MSDTFSVGWQKERHVLGLNNPSIVTHHDWDVCSNQLARGSTGSFPKGLADKSIYFIYLDILYTGVKKMFVREVFLCSPRLHLFDQLSKNETLW